ncbi:HD domain-containing protein [Thermodesulfobacteriota bacterium]
MDILQDPAAAAILSVLKQETSEAYVVGGLVRDMLLGRSHDADIDVALSGNGFEIARHLAARTKGAGFVPLDEAEGVGRVVLDRGEGPILDISSFKGNSILEDLARRDFTINAMAISLRDILDGRQPAVVDPQCGMSDLRSKSVRACSESAFVEDPLRVLRAYRFKACLGFNICPETTELLKASIKDLDRVAGERIRDELIYVLAAETSYDALVDMTDSGLIEALFPELQPMMGLEQNEYHHLDVWGHTLEVVRRMEQIVGRLPDFFGEQAGRIQAYLMEEPVRARPRIALLKLAALFHDAGKPHTISTGEDGRIHFYRHEIISEEIFSRAAERLKLAVREIRMVGTWIGGHMRSMVFTGSSLSNRTLYRLYRDFEEEVVGLIILFLSDLFASRGPAREERIEDLALERVRRAVDRFFQAEEEKQPPLLRGGDVIRLFQIAEGPMIGAVLRRVAELQGSGEISTLEEAISAAQRFLEEEQ